MQDDASPLEGWDYNEFIKFVPKASNDVMGGFFFFLGDTLSRFCKRVKDTDIHLSLFNVDARELPSYLSMENPFDCIEVCSIRLHDQTHDDNLCERRSQISVIADTLVPRKSSLHLAHSFNQKLQIHMQRC